MEQRIDSKLMLQHDEMQRIKDTQASSNSSLISLFAVPPSCRDGLLRRRIHTATVALETLFVQPIIE